MQSRIIGMMSSIGFDFQNEAVLENLTAVVLKSSEIEGELLNPEQVRSSIARKLGMDYAGLIPSDRNVDGVVDMMWDATKNFDKKLSKKRLYQWHLSLFPTGQSGMYKIKVGKWRDDSNGPMQVVSGALGKEIVHYQAPDAKIIDKEMKELIQWVYSENNLDPVLKAGIVHLWFITIHPFEDGNGRIARALTDMLLARADGTSQRFYSMSSQIGIERKQYYDILEKTQKGTLDISEWLLWFLNCLRNALKSSEIITSKVLAKHNFWNKFNHLQLNERQKLMLNKVLNGFEGKLTSSKWAKITKCSTDTALRDINDLIDKKILQKDEKGGRSTGYEMKENIL
jgi:Fic family protein